MLTPMARRQAAVERTSAPSEMPGDGCAAVGDSVQNQRTVGNRFVAGYGQRAGQSFRAADGLFHGNPPLFYPRPDCRRSPRSSSRWPIIRRMARSAPTAHEHLAHGLAEGGIFSRALQLAGFWVDFTGQPLGPRDARVLKQCFHRRAVGRFAVRVQQLAVFVQFSYEGVNPGLRWAPRCSRRCPRCMMVSPDASRVMSR